MEKEPAKEINWLFMEDYLPILAPDLNQQYIEYMTSDTDAPGIYQEISEVQVIAYSMVRYSSSPNPNDSRAMDILERKALINPRTQKPFTIEDVEVLYPEISREKCLGTTVGADGREEMVARLTVGMYRILKEAEQNST